MIYDAINLKNIFLFFFLLYLSKILNFIYKNFLRKRHNLSKRYGRDSWALITGATDGIGKQICEELAKEGFNIILVSRSLNKLKRVSTEIKQKHPSISTYEIEYDFSKLTTGKDYLSVFNTIAENFDISILVNNVGIDYEKMFKQLEIEEIFNFMNVNMTPQTVLTSIFYKKMAKRENHSAIINLSSYAADYPFAMKSLYSATKIFNHYLSLALKEENRRDKIDFLSVKPLGVDTPLSGKKANNIIAITTEQCVTGVLNDLGYEKETYGHVLHKIQANILSIIPNCVKYYLIIRLWPILSRRTNDKIN